MSCPGQLALSAEGGGCLPERGAARCDPAGQVVFSVPALYGLLRDGGDFFGGLL